MSGYKEKKKLSLIYLIHFDTKLPKPSYDIWELERGINTYTIATVYAGLQAAANLAQYHGHSEDVQRYTEAAAEVKEAGIKHLYDEKLERFIRGIFCQTNSEDCNDDKTVDSSLIYLWELDMLPVDDERVVKTMEAIENTLWLDTEVGGFARKENDHYHKIDKTVTGNPWFISTLWMARYNLRTGNTEKARKYIKWVLDHADFTGLLAEQADPNYGIGISVKPLTWSHAELVRTVNLIHELDK